MYLWLHEFDESLVDPDSKVAQDLSVLRKVKVSQAVLILFRSILTLESLKKQNWNI